MYFFWFVLLSLKVYWKRIVKKIQNLDIEKIFKKSMGQDLWPDCDISHVSLCKDFITLKSRTPLPKKWYIIMVHCPSFGAHWGACYNCANKNFDGKGRFIQHLWQSTPLKFFFKSDLTYKFNKHICTGKVIPFSMLDVCQFMEFF